MPRSTRKHQFAPGAASAAPGTSEGIRRGPETVRAAGYVRVSTEEQAKQGLSLPEQQRLIRERAGDDDVRLFVDAGISGANADRPQYQAMLAAAAAGELDVVYVWKLDRLGRDAEELLRARRMLGAAGVRLVSLTEGEDESTLVYGVRALVAQEEREKISERTSMGMAAAAAAGRVNGGPRRFGFEKGDGSGTLTPRSEEVAVVQQMFEMARAGKSQTTIARELNEEGYRTANGHAWSQPKVRYVLCDSIWIGKLVNAAGTFQIMEPLIDPELWTAVQRGFGKAGERRGKPSERFLLAGGLLRCGHCGSAMRVKSEHADDRPYDHYSCSGRRSGATDCKQPAVKREFIDAAVLNYFEQVALDVEGTVTQIADERDRRLAEVDAKLTQARKVQAEAERQIERLDSLLREGLTLDEWRRLAAVPQREGEAAALAIDDLTAEREQIEATLNTADAAGEFMKRIAALRAAVAGQIKNAEGIAATQVALRRVFDGFRLHRADAPEAPRSINAELMVDVKYVLEPLVAEDARLGTMAAGTPVLARSALELEVVGASKRSGP